METQKKQMELLREDLQLLRKQELGTTNFPEVSIVCDTPSKKRKLADSQVASEVNVEKTYARVAGVQPIEPPNQTGIKMLQNLLKFGKPPLEKSPRNICFGSAKTSGEGGGETMLAANVDLVASY